MNSPLAALSWEIWRRGRGYAWLSIACVLFCAFVNGFVLDGFHAPASQEKVWQSVFGVLMVLSFLFLMGAFNSTETNATKEWNGFPYRLFILPVRTWRLVALPMIYGVLAVELLYVAWIKLVWTHHQIEMPEWFAVVFGACMIFYQTALWTLAGYRIFCVLVISLGGLVSFALACLPLIARVLDSSWLNEGHMIAVLLVLATAAFIIAWANVVRQRSGGGQRRTWTLPLFWRMASIFPRRRKDFASPGAAQFWFEWRRTGWLLPACTAVVLMVIIAPVSWFNRDDPRYTNYVFGRLLAVPLLLAFVIGKGFAKCEFWTKDLFISPFMAVRPLRAEDFVIAKMKVAALGVAITWLLIILFMSLWLPLWADTSTLVELFFGFRMLYPNSWVAILVLGSLGYVVLTWRCMVSGLWAGLSGKPLYYFGSAAIQVLAPILLMVVCAIWPDSVDLIFGDHHNIGKLAALQLLAWGLALVVIARFWFGAFSWSRITPQHAFRYLIVWSAATLCFLLVAFLARPVLDVFRYEHIYLLAALWIFPFARVGIAPRFLSGNRHRS